MTDYTSADTLEGVTAYTQQTARSQEVKGYHQPQFYHQPKHGGIMNVRPETFPRLVSPEELLEL